MKSYYIQQEEKLASTEASASTKTETPVKKWKAFLALLALIAAAFLIIKLQQTEGTRPSLQSLNTTARDIVKNPGSVKEENRKKTSANPASNLKATMNWRKKLIGGMILEGTLYNSDPAVNIKDPVLIVTWLSKTNTIIGTSRYPLDEYIAAGETIPYKLKVKAPSKIANVKLSVETATVVK